MSDFCAKQIEFGGWYVKDGCCKLTEVGPGQNFIFQRIITTDYIIFKFQIQMNQ